MNYLSFNGSDSILLAVMPPRDNRLGLGCMTVIFLVIGSIYIVKSLVALNHGKTVYLRRAQIHANPWLILVFGGTFLAVGIAAAWKMYKDKDKYPF